MLDKPIHNQDCHVARVLTQITQITQIRQIFVAGRSWRFAQLFKSALICEICVRKTAVSALNQRLIKRQQRLCCGGYAIKVLGSDVGEHGQHWAHVGDASEGYGFVQGADRA